MSAEVVPIRRPPPRPPVVTDWRERVDYKQTRRGDEEILHTLANATTILRNDPAWVGVLGWDDLAQGIVCRREPPWYADARCIDDADGAYDPQRPWDDTDGCRVQNWLQRKWFLTVSEQTAYRAALLVAKGRRFDPLRDWLEGLRHDERPRIDRWLTTYLGVEDTPYARFVGRAFLIGSYARAVRPGCKMDSMLILEGPQGLFKSQAVRRLYGSDYFRESPIDLRSTDRFLALRGCWCREWPELDGLGKADANRVKNFLSAEVDDFRAPYARGMVSQPRRCVLVATCNPPQLGYLTDETGNRRMLPVQCGKVGPIDLDAITADRDQLWAETAALYAAKVKWWPVTPEERRICNQEQDSRMVAEVWTGKIGQWLGEGTRLTAGAEVTIRQVLADCLSVPAERWDMGNSKRVGACLTRNGWIVGGQYSTGARERFYVKRSEPAPVDEDEEREAIAGEAEAAE